MVVRLDPGTVGYERLPGSDCREMAYDRQITLLAIAGTRPEVLKLAPLIRLLRAEGSAVITKTCFSGQHLEILESVLGDLDVAPDVDLRSPARNRTLSQHVAWLLERLDAALAAVKPDGVIVQGDTNSAFTGALVAHHRQIPSFHVEAGLRTSDPNRPFPEEMNRRLVARMAALHFAPTPRARDNLLAEGVPPEAIHVTGNTGIDALRIYAGRESPAAEAILSRLRPGTRRLLVTLHRRENEQHVAEVTSAVRQIVLQTPDVDVLWILHLNGIRKHVTAALEGHPAVHLLEPQPYRSFVHLMKAAHIILSDSGGVQEEAPVLGTPVLVLREDTERREAVEAGSSRVVGCQTKSIMKACRHLLDNDEAYRAMSQARSPFGDGHASARIAQAITRHYFPEENRFVMGANGGDVAGGLPRDVVTS